MPTTSTVSFKMLDVSTAHLSPKTRQRLETFDVNGVLFYPKGPWGWFVSVPTLADALIVGDEVPSDLKTCIEFAQTLEKEWIMFDCDGSIVQELPTFDDDEVHTSTNQDYLQHLAQAYASHLNDRHGRNFKATVNNNGKIIIKDDLENGMHAILSPEFVQAMVMKHLPVVDLNNLQPLTV